MQRNRRSFTIAAAVLAALFTAASGALAAGSAEDAGSSGPMTIEADSYSLSTPVRDLDATDQPPARLQAPPRINPLADEPGQGARGTRSPGASADRLAGRAGRSNGRTPPPDLLFEGTSNPFSCGGCAPPDTIGDVGSNHYIQMTNATKVGIHDKSGTLLTPRFDLGELWPSGPCTGNRGDPVVVYDELADRWLLSQFQGAPPPNRLCFAISETSDPLGSYHLYEFTPPEFPDYFKVGVWPTGYYVSANESSYTAYAFDRAKMLAGDPTASFIRFAGETNFLLPADVDGANPPDPQGGLFYTFKDNGFHGGGDRLELFQLTPDFPNPASSTFSMIETIPVTPFTYTVCGFFEFECIPQQGTAQRVDAVSEWPMWRLAYRRFADREVLLGNFTVDVGSDRAGIRWFELRDTGSGYAMFQEGTHAPSDGVHRFMGSIATDEQGNVALGFSASSGSLFPSIRYATRCVGDPLGTLQAEQTLQAGGGSQTGTDRWGDYSAMSIDPSDDSTFWYTNEYYNPSSASNWKTKIGNFQSGCGPPPPAAHAQRQSRRHRVWHGHRPRHQLPGRLHGELSGEPGDHAERGAGSRFNVRRVG